MDGIIIINKDKGLTSFDVVYKLRKMLKIKKIGHAGTLDPMARGVLPVMLGKATKLLDILPNDDKAYVASFSLGIVTDTLDITGKILSKNKSNISQKQVEQVLQKFKGKILQVPPMYSAIKKDGKKLYELARSGKEVKRDAREINIKKLDLISFDENLQQGKFMVECSKGTYVRSLCDDIGKELTCGACMSALNRISACGFNLDESITLAQVQEFCNSGNISDKIIPMEQLFSSYLKVNISQNQTKRFINGNYLSLTRIFVLKNKNLQHSQLVRVYSDKNEFLGLGKINKEMDRLEIHKLLYSTSPLE